MNLRVETPRWQGVSESIVSSLYLQATAFKAPPLRSHSGSEARRSQRGWLGPQNIAMFVRVSLVWGVSTFEWQSPHNGAQLLERLKTESHLFDSACKDGTIKVSIPTLSKGGALVSGRLSFRPLEEGCQVKLQTRINLYRLLMPLIFVVVVLCLVLTQSGHSLSSESSRGLFGLIVGPVVLLQLLQSSFVPWARRKLRARVEDVLQLNCRA